MKLLALPRYTRLAASSRLRTYQYLTGFEKAGIEVECKPLLDNSYVRALNDRKHASAAIMRGYWGRFRSMLASRTYDVVYVEKEVLPWLPPSIELGLLNKSVRLVVDCDDAIFHRYDQHPSTAVRALLSRKLDRVMARADLVTAGNGYLAERARSAGSRWVERVPTVIDLDRYPVVDRMTGSGDEVVIGWIGSPSTAEYLRRVSEALQLLTKRYRIRCIAIGARPDQVAGTPFETVAWHEDTEVASLYGVDIGIMPLPDAPWERGKCGCKLIQYMACELPVVASPVGVNSDIVRHGETGFHAEGTADWIVRLEQLILDEGLRARMGAAGRRRVENEFSLQIQGPRLTGLLKQLGAS